MCVSVDRNRGNNEEESLFIAHDPCGLCVDVSSVLNRTKFGCVAAEEGNPRVDGRDVEGGDAREVAEKPTSAPDVRVTNLVESLVVVSSQRRQCSSRIVHPKDDETCSDIERCRVIGDYARRLVGLDEDFTDDAAEPVRAAFDVGETRGREGDALWFVEDDREDLDGRADRIGSD